MSGVSVAAQHRWSVCGWVRTRKSSGISLSVARALRPRGSTQVWLGLMGGASLAGLFRRRRLLTGPAARSLRAAQDFRLQHGCCRRPCRMLQFTRSVPGAEIAGAAAGRSVFLAGLPTTWVSKTLLTEIRAGGALKGARHSRAAAVGGPGPVAMPAPMRSDSASPATGTPVLALGCCSRSAAPCLLIAPLRITIAPKSPLVARQSRATARAVGRRVVRSKTGRLGGARPRRSVLTPAAGAGRLAAAYFPRSGAIRHPGRLHVFHLSGSFPYFAVEHVSSPQVMDRRSISRAAPSGDSSNKFCACFVPERLPGLFDREPHLEAKLSDSEAFVGGGRQHAHFEHVDASCRRP